MDSRQSFYVVEFDNHSTAVIPGTWIFKDKDGFSCYWSSSITRVKDYEFPNPRWQVFHLQRIVARRGK
jgi:hypothetical protein